MLVEAKKRDAFLLQNLEAKTHSLLSKSRTSQACPSNGIMLLYTVSTRFYSQHAPCTRSEKTIVPTPRECNCACSETNFRAIISQFQPSHMYIYLLSHRRALSRSLSLAQVIAEKKRHPTTERSLVVPNRPHIFRGVIMGGEMSLKPIKHGREHYSPPCTLHTSVRYA